MRRALFALLLFACRSDPPQGSTTSSTASVTPSTSTSAGEPVAPHASTPPVSDWSDANTPQPVELANAPNRSAVVGFDAMKGGYFVTRGERTQVLPREWFGAGPPRKDLSVSADGTKLGVPDGDAMVLYDTSAKRWIGRFEAPQAQAKPTVSLDGKYVVWTSAKGACSRTEIATKTLQKSCP